MEKTNDLDSLLNGCESAKIFFASLPDYVRGAVIRNSSEIKTEDELHAFADKIMHEFT